MSWRRRLYWVAAIAVLAALVLLTPQADGPDSTVALRRFLGEMGFQVTDATGLPDPGGTLVILRDLRPPDEVAALLGWAEAGGQLVVADRASTLLPLLGVAIAGPIGFAGTAELAPLCLAPEVVGIGHVVVRASDVALRTDDEAFVACFPSGEGAFLLTRPHGAGRITLLGGMSPLTNALLANSDNARLAAAIVAPGPRVAFGAPEPPAAANAGVWELLPDGARIGIVAMVLSVIAFAAVRARRLGMPSLEAAIAPIPASELVRATAQMYRRNRAIAFCAKLMREASIRRLLRGRSVGLGDAELIGLVAHASGIPEPRVEQVLRGADPRTDEELIRLAGALDDLAARGRRDQR